MKNALYIQKRRKEIGFVNTAYNLSSILLIIISVFSLFYFAIKSPENKTLRAKWILVSITSTLINLAIKNNLEETEKDLNNIKILDREHSKLLAGLTLHELEETYSLDQPNPQKEEPQDPFLAKELFLKLAEREC